MDRAIGVVAPGLALRRYGARVRLQAALHFFGGTGGYEGARSDRPATKGWATRADSPDGSSLPDLAKLRERSGDLYRNNGLARGAINTQVINQVGGGLIPYPRIDREYLKLGDTEADAAESMLSRLYWQWARRRWCDFSQRFTFGQLQGLALKSWLTRGDVVAIPRFREPAKGRDLLGLRIQLIEADRISNPNWGPDTTTLRGGVELSEDGAPVAVHIMSAHPGDQMFGVATWTRVPVLSKDGQLQVLHAMTPERIDATRGVPYFSAVIEHLRELGEWSGAELHATVLNSFFTVFVKSQFGGGLPNMDPSVNGVVQQPAAPADDNDVRLGRGAIVNLVPGEEIQVADPKRPNTNFEAGWRAFCTHIGAGLDMPAETLMKRFESSYSASRAARLEFWSAVTYGRSLVVDSLVDPVYEMIVSEAVDRGFIHAPGFHEDPLVRDAWCEARWSGPTMGELDVVDAITAAKLRADLGVETLEDITANMTGGDWTQNNKQRGKEQRARVAEGLTGETVGERIITEPKEPAAPTDAPPANNGPARGRRGVQPNDARDNAEARRG